MNKYMSKCNWGHCPYQPENRKSLAACGTPQRFLEYFDTGSWRLCSQCKKDLHSDLDKLLTENEKLKTELEELEEENQREEKERGQMNAEINRLKQKVQTEEDSKNFWQEQSREKDKENEQMREKMTSLMKRISEMERVEIDLQTEKSRLKTEFENLERMEKDRKRKREEEKQAEEERIKRDEEKRQEERKKRRMDRLKQIVRAIQTNFSSWRTTIPIGKENIFVKNHMEWIKLLAESEETRAYLDTHEHQEYKVDLEKGTFKIKVRIEEIHMRCIAEKVPNVGNLFLHRVPKKLRYFYWIASLKVFLKKTRGESRWNHAIKKLGVSNIASTLINQGLWWETLIEETARIVEDIKKLETEDEKSFLDLVNKILQTQ